METSGWIQFAIYLIALALVTKPMGLYLMHVLDANGKTWLDPVLAPVERFTYRAMGVDARKEHDWKQYTLAMLLFSLVGCLFTYAILRLQYFLPLNPQKLAGVSPDLSFNTAISFTTNTNWQNYGGESTMSYFSQMVGLAFHNFVSAATGIAIAAALVRAIARHSATTLGNFWVDLVRVTYYLLLPICLVFAVFLVSQGMIQNFKPYTKATLVEPMKIQVEKKNDKGETIKGPDGKAVTEEQTVTDQNIVQGPMASQVAIKMLGTNGGGYVNANAAHPFENPTPLSNFIQMLSIFSIGSGLTYYLGRMVKNQKHGWTVWAAMLILFVGGVLLCWWAEANGNPIHQQSRRRRRQHGGQGSPVRHLQFRAVRHDHNRCLLRRGQFDARFVHRARRLRAVVQHSTWRSDFRRRRRGVVRDAGFRCARGLHRGPDGRSHAGISRQKNRSLRREDGDALVAHPRHFDSRFCRLGCSEQMGPGRTE